MNSTNETGTDKYFKIVDEKGKNVIMQCQNILVNVPNTEYYVIYATRGGGPTRRTRPLYRYVGIIY